MLRSQTTAKLLLKSIFSEFPSDDCYWTSEKHFTHISVKSIIDRKISPARKLTCCSDCCHSNYVLQMSDSIDDMGEVRWQLACLLALSWVIIFLVLLKGVESLGKVRPLHTTDKMWCRRRHCTLCEHCPPPENSIRKWSAYPRKSDY